MRTHSVDTLWKCCRCVASLRLITCVPSVTLILPTGKAIHATISREALNKKRYGSGSVKNNNGSGSGKPKKVRIRIGKRRKG